MKATWLKVSLQVALTVSCAATGTSVGAQIWQPIPVEELQQKVEPLAPAAPAIYLYRQIDRDDDGSSETVHERIKVLTEQGRDYGDVRLSYGKWERIRAISARVVQPSGAIAEFDGEIYDKPLVSDRDDSTGLKSFSLPNVQVGSIVEYRYTRELRSGWVYNSQWLLSADLFTKSAKFSLKPYRDFTLRWSWPAGLPQNTAAPRREKKMVFLETANVPAFVTEESMPPPVSLKYRVNFQYDTNTRFTNPDAWWDDYAANTYSRIQGFTQDQLLIKRVLGQILSAEDSPEQKARKIYARVQQIRNLTYRPPVSEAEAAREGFKQNYKAHDVLERNYGSEIQIGWLCYGMLKTAGLDVSYLIPASREYGFFSPQLMDAGSMDGSVILLRLGAREVFLDAGTPLLPFGVLPWYKTQVQGLLVARGGGTWTPIPLPPPTEGLIQS
jgi:hypothetical protein